MDKLAVLKKSELFANLDDAELGILETITDFQEVPVGTFICKQGQQENKIYIVENGSMAIILELTPLSHHQVQAVSNYETFGWSSMVEPYICTASVKATVTSNLLTIDAERLRVFCNNRPNTGCKIYRSVARIVAKRLREAYVQLLGVSDADAIR